MRLNWFYYDGEEKTDFAVVHRTDGFMIWYIINSLDGSFRTQQFGLNTDYAAPGDYDGDGKFDIAVQRGGTNTAANFYVLGSLAGFLVWYILQSTNNQLNAVNFGLSETDSIVQNDYDGDGAFMLASVWQYQICFLTNHRENKPLANVKEQIEKARCELNSNLHRLHIIIEVDTKRATHRILNLNFVDWATQYSQPDKA